MKNNDIGFIFSPDFDEHISGGENGDFAYVLERLNIPYILYIDDLSLKQGFSYYPEKGIKSWIYRGGIKKLHQLRRYFNEEYTHTNSPVWQSYLYDFCTLSDYRYNEYSHKLKLLNDKYIILPFGEISKRYIGKRVFIRPLSGSKSSPAGTILAETYEDFKLNYQDLYNIDDSELFVVAEAKDILKEYRFIVINGEIVAGSKYQVLDDILYERVQVNQFPFTAVKSLISTYNTSDNMYSVDIATINNNGLILPKVLEINSVTCASWYDCDYSTIIHCLLKEVERVKNEEA